METFVPSSSVEESLKPFGLGKLVRSLTQAKKKELEDFLKRLPENSGTNLGNLAFRLKIEKFLQTLLKNPD